MNVENEKITTLTKKIDELHEAFERAEISEIGLALTKLPLEDLKRLIKFLCDYYVILEDILDLKKGKN